jgi:DNA repair exonuclease SbcCD ATPase subunit
LIKSQIDFIDTNLSSLRGENVYLQKNIENYQLEEEKQVLLVNQWKIYELFINCVSKKGLPSTLLKEMLPSLNREVKEILSDIVDFTVDIEIHDDDLEIYLNQQDQRRIIETASGMEKMITSLAIRVGLINISNLPKSNIFIIDEGFGALDDTNIGSCIKLLESFKRFFKTILIISHVDAVKDAVDNTIYIEKVGNDSYVRFE